MPKRRKDKPDFIVYPAGMSLMMLEPLTPLADDWVETHLPANRQTFGKAVAVEPRYISDIVEGARQYGLIVA